MRTSAISKKAITGHQYLALAVLSFAIVIIAWSILSFCHLVNPLLLPTPLAVGRAFIRMVSDSSFLTDIGISVYRVMLGFFVSVVLGVPLGIAIGTYRRAEAFLEPINDFLRYIPVPAFLPLIILWVGIGNANQVATIFVGTFFQLVLLVADSVSRVAKDFVEAGQTIYGHNARVLILHVLIPSTAPDIYDNMRIAVGWAWSYLVLAEVVAANSGIGHTIVQAQRFVQTDVVIAGIIVVGLLGLVLDYIFKILFPFFFPWSEKGGA
jgi:NitT/TauT family transport system permease protein